MLSPLDLSVAQIDLPVSPAVRTALENAISSRGLGYASHVDTADVIDAFVYYCLSQFAWTVEEPAVRLLPDVVRAFMVAIELGTGPNGVVVVPTPCYPVFLRIPGQLGRRVVTVESLDGRTLNFEALQVALASHPGCLVVLCNPNNPTGAVLTRAELDVFDGLAEQYDCMVFADEIFAPITYDIHRHVPYASMSAGAYARTMTAMSASKPWGLSGMKCSQFVIGSPAKRADFDQLGRLFTDGVSTIGARCTGAAYRAAGAELPAIVAAMEVSRSYVVNRAADLGARVAVAPAGTFMLWMDFRGLAPKGTDVAELLNRRSGLKLTGAKECGMGDLRWARMNFGVSTGMLENAFDRIESTDFGAGRI